MDDLDRTIEILRNLIAFPTISPDSNIDLIHYASEILREAGAKIDLMQSPCGQKMNLFATIGPEGDGGILLSGHSDVVPVTEQDWTTDPFQMTEKEGRLFGRGACDMKGFIAATLAVAPTLAGHVKNRPLHFAYTYDEETGCFGARHLAEILQERRLTPGVAIIGEPTEMRIIEGHKGCFEYTTRFTGLPGHGSLPDQGVNAVEYATRYVTRLLSLKDRLRELAPLDSKFDPPETTLNIGAISGGVAHNVIAPTAKVDWEMRPVRAIDADFVKSEMATYVDQDLLPKMRAIHPGASIETEILGEVAGLSPTDENEAKRIVMELTGANDTDLVSFGTEAGIFQALGMDVVVCGPGSIEQAHKADEYVSKDQLVKCLDMLIKLSDHL